MITSEKVFKKIGVDASLWRAVKMAALKEDLTIEEWLDKVLREATKKVQS